MAKPTQGPFITLEGGEGAGKSTQARRLADRIERCGHDVILTREPGGSSGAEAIRTLLLTGDADRWSFTSEALLFAAARADHLEKTVRPARESGAWVVCDRFHLSTRAYQGVDTERMAQVMALETMVLAHDEPDLAFVLDVSETVAASRLCARGGDADRMEGKGAAFHAGVRARFRSAAKHDPTAVLIDADGSEDDIFDALWRTVAERWPTVAGKPAL